MGKGPLVHPEEETRRAPELMWKALRRKFLSHSGECTTIPWTVLSVDTQSLSFFTMEPQQLYHIQGCAMTVVVFQTVTKESHCILVTIVMELMQNAVDVGKCCKREWLQIFVSEWPAVTVVGRYFGLCRLALGPVVPCPCHKLSYEKLCTGRLVCSKADVFNRCVLPDSNFTWYRILHLMQFAKHVKVKVCIVPHQLLT
jgi:hypothetical protein